VRRPQRRGGQCFTFETAAHELRVRVRCRQKLRERLSGVLDVSPVEAGLQTAAWFRRKVDGTAAVTAAEKRELEVLPLSRFSSRPLAREGLLLGFAAVDANEIRRCVTELAAALESL